jgi:uncharacterized peroxidase-related enzyme
LSLPEYERLSRVSGNQSQLSSTNLLVVEESEATGEVAALYNYFRTHFGRADVPGILKCFATHPPMLRHIMELSESLIFNDGYLCRRHKEMIATSVSVQNRCGYCSDSHGYFLRVHGGSPELLCALQQNDIDDSTLSTAEKTLLRFSMKVNVASHSVAPDDIEDMRQAGWEDMQICETVHIVAMFATFNRVANAFGLSSQGLIGLMDQPNVSKNPEFTDIETGTL